MLAQHALKQLYLIKLTQFVVLQYLSVPFFFVFKWINEFESNFNRFILLWQFIIETIGLYIDRYIIYIIFIMYHSNKNDISNYEKEACVLHLYYISKLPLVIKFKDSNGQTCNNLLYFLLLSLSCL